MGRCSYGTGVSDRTPPRLELWHDAENTIIPPNVNADRLYSVVARRLYEVSMGGRVNKSAPEIGPVHWSLVMPAARAPRQNAVLQRLLSKPGVVHVDPGNNNGGTTGTLKSLMNAWIREQQYLLKQGDKRTRRPMPQTVAVLLSTSADFLDELQALRRLGVRSIVINSHGSASSGLSRHATVLNEWQQFLQASRVGTSATAPNHMASPRDTGRGGGAPPGSPHAAVASAETDKGNAAELSRDSAASSTISCSPEPHAGQSPAATTQSPADAPPSPPIVMADCHHQRVQVVERPNFANHSEHFPLKLKEAANRLKRQGSLIADTTRWWDMPAESGGASGHQGGVGAPTSPTSRIWPTRIGDALLDATMRREELSVLQEKAVAAVTSATVGVAEAVAAWGREEVELAAVHAACKTRATVIQSHLDCCSTALGNLPKHGCEAEEVRMKEWLEQLRLLQACIACAESVVKHWREDRMLLHKAEDRFYAASQVLRKVQQRADRHRRVANVAIAKANRRVEECKDAVAAAKVRVEEDETSMRALSSVLPELQCSLTPHPINDGLHLLHVSGLLRQRNVQTDYHPPEDTVGAAHPVLHVRCRSDGSHKALKMLSLHQAKEVQREVLLPSRLQHPNIMRVELAFVQDAFVYVQTPWCEAGDLGQWLRSSPRSVSECCAMLGGVLRGLAYLHDHGIVHGDIKPGNILVDNELRPRISDWGLSRERLGITSVGDAASTLQGYSEGYAAPELLAPTPAKTNFASDVFAAGRVMQAMLKAMAEPVDADERAMKAEVSRVAEACVAEEPAARLSVHDVLQSDGATFASSGVRAMAKLAMSERALADMTRQHVQWQRAVDGTWQSYCEADNVALERCFTLFYATGAGSAASGYELEGGRACMPDVVQPVSGDRFVLFQSMQEMGKEGTVKVRREVLASYPFPPSWPRHSANYAVERLKAGTGDEWQLVFRNFSRDMPSSARIVAVDRVQNRHLWQRYMHQRRAMGCDAANEEWAWHGTRATSPSALCEGFDGLDIRLAGRGWYGRGGYVAENAAYSDDSYVHKTSITVEGEEVQVRQLLLCKVLCGKVKEYGKARSDKLGSLSRLVRPPAGYDSVRGGPHRSPSGEEETMMRVIYDRSCVYPMYVVSYSYPTHEALQG